MSLVFAQLGVRKPSWMRFIFDGSALFYGLVVWLLLVGFDEALAAGMHQLLVQSGIVLLLLWQMGLKALG